MCGYLRDLQRLGLGVAHVVLEADGLDLLARRDVCRHDELEDAALVWSDHLDSPEAYDSDHPLVTGVDDLHHITVQELDELELAVWRDDVVDLGGNADVAFADVPLHCHCRVVACGDEDEDRSYNTAGNNRREHESLLELRIPWIVTTEHTLERLIYWYVLYHLLIVKSIQTPCFKPLLFHGSSWGYLP